MDTTFDIFVDGFRYPFYPPDAINNEIQAVNHEFYDEIN
jgi:secreted Zn-dependent insulinase-like peptidase